MSWSLHPIPTMRGDEPDIRQLVKESAPHTYDAWYFYTHDAYQYRTKRLKAD